MSANDLGPDGEPAQDPADSALVQAIQVGQHNIQNNYFGGWPDGTRPLPAAGQEKAESPYQGLNAFTERDAAFFFGREQAAEQVLEKMSGQLGGAGLLVVSGVSGAGKSSLLSAGVLPKLREEGLRSAPGSQTWPWLSFTPAHDPLRELAVMVANQAGIDSAGVRRTLLDNDLDGFALTVRQAALRHPGEQAEGAAAPRRLLLVIDQFEQLFTQCPDKEQRQAFIRALHAAATARQGPDQVAAALVVLAVRADFEARCAEDFPQLTEAIQHRYLVLPMTRRQLRMVITEPAVKAGSRVDEELTQVLLGEVSGHRAGVLPLLSYALDQAWRSRTGDVLTLADYDRTGGIEGAVEASAQRAYERLTSGQQAAARQVFTRLVAIGGDGTETADRVRLAELMAGKNAAQALDVAEVLTSFADERLLTFGAEGVEITHEVLLTAWPLLRDTWLADSRADRLVLTRLRAVSAEWAARRNEPSYLYRGHLLAAATETAARTEAGSHRHSPLGKLERDFLAASQRARRRRALRLRVFVAMLLTLVAGLGVSTVVAVRSVQTATRQRDIATADNLVATAGNLAAQSGALADTDPVLSRLLSVAAWRIDPSGKTRDAMLNAAASPAVASITGIPAGAMALSPDGKTMAIALDGATVQLLDAATGRPLGRPFARGATPSTALAFGPDGATLAIGRDDGTVQVWDLQTGHQLGGTITVASAAIDSLAFNAGGTILATSAYNGMLRIWNTGTGAPVTGLIHAGTGGLLSALMFGHDGSDDNDLAVADSLGNGAVSITFRDASSGKQLGHSLTVDAGAVSYLALSQELTLATDNNSEIELWDVSNGQQIGSPVPFVGQVVAMAFSPDGTLVTSTANGPTQRWDVAASQPVSSPLVVDAKAASNIDQTVSMALGRDGKTLTSSSLDGHGTVTVKRWNIATAQQAGGSLSFPAGDGVFQALSHDGSALAVGGAGGVQLWDVATGKKIGGTFAGGLALAGSLAFSPDGRTLATITADGPVRLWDLATRQQAGSPISDGTALFTSLAFSPDGKTLATGTVGGAVQLWDVTTHKRIEGPAINLGGVASALAFSPDGATLVTGTFEGDIQLWDVATHQQIGGSLTTGGSEADSLAFGPDGTTLVVESSNPGPSTVQEFNVKYLVKTERYLCAAAGRTLTHAEWTQYAPGVPYQDVCPGRP